MAGIDLLHLLDCAASYHIYDRDNKLIQVADARRAQVLISRRLLVGRTKTKRKVTELIGLWLAPGVTVRQVKHVVRLKPPAVSICNKSTVVIPDGLASTYTHRSSLAKGM